MSIASRETKLTDAWEFYAGDVGDSVVRASEVRKLEQALGEAQEALQHYADAENSPMARRTLRIIAAHLKAGD